MDEAIVFGSVTSVDELVGTETRLVGLAPEAVFDTACNAADCNADSIDANTEGATLLVVDDERLHAAPLRRFTWGAVVLPANPGAIVVCVEVVDVAIGHDKSWSMDHDNLLCG